jgi:hypothetical protein
MPLISFEQKTSGMASDVALKRQRKYFLLAIWYQGLCFYALHIHGARGEGCGFVGNGD